MQTRNMNADAYLRPGLVESESWSRVFPNAHLIAHLLVENVDFNINLLVGVFTMAVLLGFVALLLGFANGAWIVVVAALPILWARRIRAASKIAEHRFCGDN